MRLVGTALAVSLSTLLVPLAASANSAGVAGYSRKPSAFAPQGESCSQCHTGGAAPQVTINGPASLAAGQSAEYTLVVSTGLARAAGGVAATDGVILTPSVNGGFRDSFGEMVQDAPRTPTGGEASFRFRVTAPATGTAIKLWAVGLGANNSGSTAGDGVAHTTRDITVTGGTPTPPMDAGASSSGGTSSGGTPPENDGGTSSSGDNPGSSSSSGDPTKGDDGDPATNGGGDDTDEAGNGAGPGKKTRPSTTTESEGLACSTAVPGAASSVLAPALGLGMIVLGLSARRRRR